MRLDVIVRVTTKFFLPFMLLFALYVQLHGDFGPGGGFQAGVITAATVILYAIIFGLAPTMRLVPPIVVESMVPLGVLIFLGVGVAGFVTGDNYLNYSHLAHDQVHGQELGVMLVEAGVLVTVCGTMIAIFYTFADRGRS
jgi:multicomponent Na+:H+ antiporter subunit B